MKPNHPKFVLLLTAYSLLLFGLALPKEAHAAECKVPEYDREFKSAYDPSELEDLFQKAHLSYHGYIQCLFENATSTIIAPYSKSTVADSANELICTPPQKRNEMLKTVDPVKLMQQSLAAYNAYTDYLKEIRDLSANHRAVNAPKDVRELIGPHKEMAQIIDQEVQYALVAIDRALLNFKELRQAFLVHLHLECLLFHLEKVLTLYGDLRSITTGLPKRIENASIH